MIYREAGQFRTSYAADEALFPIRQDRLFVCAIVIFAFLVVPFAASEYLLRGFHEHYGVDYVVLRYMNVYGPRQDGGLVINVLRRIQAGEAPTIQGDGSQSFDFVHVADVARANIRAMESDVTDDAFNIGGGNEATVREIVERLIDLSGSDLEPDVQADVKVPMMRRVGSNEKAASLLEWKPSFDLEAGLRDVIGKG